VGVPQSVPEISEFLFYINSSRRNEIRSHGNVGFEKDGEMDGQKSNEEVLQRVNETRTMLDTVRKCKRVVRACAKTSLLHYVIEGRINGKTTRGRK